jgi:hypothetical protein
MGCYNYYYYLLRLQYCYYCRMVLYSFVCLERISVAVILNIHKNLTVHRTQINGDI